jgi:hypothetical protein
VRLRRIAWVAAVVLVVSASVPAIRCAARRATGTGPWRIEQSRAPRVSIRGGEVTVTDVRGFTWRSDQDFDPAWFDARYDLAELDRMAFYYVPLNASASVAHVFVSFGFGPEEWLAVSVEARRRPAESYTILRAMQRRYELIYVIGDERDIVGKRAWGEKAPVYCWPVKLDREALRRFFLATMNRANDVAERPESYGVLTNTCATNVVLNAQRAGSGIRINLDILLSGTMDRLAYGRGVFDTTLTFEDAKRAARIDERLRALTDRSREAFAAAAHVPLDPSGAP